MAKASGSIDLNSLKVAGEGASKYITQIDGGGIKVHDVNAVDTDFVQITSSGMNIYQGGNTDSNVVASFGSTTVIGSTGSNKLFLSSDEINFNTKEEVSAFNIDLDAGTLPIKTSYNFGTILIPREFNHTNRKTISITSVAAESCTLSKATFKYDFSRFNFGASTAVSIGSTSNCTAIITSNNTYKFPEVLVTPNSKQISKGNSYEYYFVLTIGSYSFRCTVTVTYNSSNQIISTFNFIGSNFPSGSYAFIQCSKLGFFTRTNSVLAPAYTIGNRYIDANPTLNISGGYSTAMGFGLKAQTEYQVVLGVYNDNNNNNIFEIGNGTSDASRSNIFEITNTGTVMAGGSIKVKGHDGYIGDNNAQSNSTTMGSGNPSTGTYRTTGVYFTLSAGVYILIGRISYASNTTGRRVALWGHGSSQPYSTLDHSISNQTYTTGAATNVQTIAIATPGSDITYRLLGFQNSGSTLDINAYARVVRIR